MPGMFLYLEGESPSPNLMEVKGSEAQGRHREVWSEGSVEQRCEPTNRNWIGGAPVGRVRVRARSPYPSRTTGVNPAVVHRQYRGLPRETCGLSDQGSIWMGLRPEQSGLNTPQESADGIVGAWSTEGPNGVERSVGGASWERYERQPTNSIGL